MKNKEWQTLPHSLWRKMVMLGKLTTMFFKTVKKSKLYKCPRMEKSYKRHTQYINSREDDVAIKNLRYIILIII